MKNLKLLCIILLMTGLNVSGFSQTFDPNAWDGKVYFKVKSTSMTEIADFRAGMAYSNPDFYTILTKYNVTAIFKPFPNLHSTELQQTYQMNFEKKDSVLFLIADLQSIDYIEYAEKIPLERIFAIPPADPLYTTQWALNQINAVGAWNIHPTPAMSTGYSNNNVVIAVVDNEVMTSHQDLMNNLWVNTGEIPGDFIDNDGNGYIDDINGWDSGDNDGNPSPPSAAFDHGTHVAGIAVGETDNAFGIASLSWNVRLMAIKGTADLAPPSSLTNPWAGVSYAIENGADIINMSWGGSGSSVTCQNIINYGTSLGIIFVAAAGNSNLDLAVTPFFPAMYNNVITVGSTGTTTNFDEKSSFSNYGVGIDVMAPGWNIISSTSASTSSYGLKSGTSMASPLVASLCGLMKSYNPYITAAQIISCITSTCDNISTIASNGSYPGQLGAGRINAQAALQCLLTSPVVAFSSSSNAICPASSVTFFDNSTGATATAWSWTFPGGTPGTSTLANPVVTYNTPGIYPVTLAVTNALGTNTLTQANFIVVSGSCSITNLTQGNWYFGKKAGVSFTSGIPVAINAAVVNNTINSAESTVSISDPITGNILFYTDAVSLWDANHILVTSGLTGNNSRSQILAVPNPANANQYFLFHSPESSSTSPINFIYSIVDVTGGVVTVPAMNITVPLPVGANSISEHITAVPHCNGRDYWIIVHGHSRINSTLPENFKFYIYLLSPFGLTNKAMSAPTPDSYTFTLRAPTLGQLKASPDGSRLAIAGWGGGGSLGLYDFDKSTGIISNEVVLSSNVFSFYGCAFDPSGSFLYASTLGTSNIFAWDLSNLSAGSSTITSASAGAGGLQLGPNGIIYVARNTSTNFIGAINPPYNTTSLYVPNAVNLQSCVGCAAAAVTSRLTLPNFVEVPMPAPTAPSFTYSLHSNCTTVDFSSACYGNYTATWNFGDLSPTATGPNVTHNYAATGTYTVTLTLSNALENFVVNQTITIINPAATIVITGPNPVCFDNTTPDDYSITPVSGATYNWTVTNGTIVSPSPSTSNLISVNWTGPGVATISVSITIGACTSVISTINVIVNPLPVIAIAPAAASICTGGSVNLTASGASSYTWSPPTGLSCSTCANTNASPATTTTYTVTGVDANGCANTQTITINVGPGTAPTVTVNSSTICAGQMTFLTAVGSPSGGTYSWSPTTALGCSTCPTTTATPAVTTIYTVSYTQGGCTGSAISTVTVTPAPVATFSYTGSPFCTTAANPSPVFSGGGVAGTFSSTSGLVFVSTFTGQINLASSTPGTYIITNTIPASSGCPAVTATYTITINNCVTLCTTCTTLPSSLAASPALAQVYCVNAPLTITGPVTFALCELKMAPAVTITVNPGATLTISGSHLYSCGNMWQGIVVKPGGRVVVQNFVLGSFINRSSLIEDALVAIDINAGSTLTTGILSVTNATFNRNDVGIRVSGYTLPLATYPFSIVSSVFTCRDIPFVINSINWPQTNAVRTAPAPASPLMTPYINSTTYSETNAAAYLKPPFTTSLPGAKPRIAIDLQQVGNVAFSGVTPSAWYEIKIGNNGIPNYNVFDNHTVCINAFNANFTSVNNVFQNTINTNNSAGIAILANAKDLNCRAQVIPGTPTGLFNNRFYDCTYSINTNNYFENTFTFCDVRSIQPGFFHFLAPPHTLPLLNHRGQYGFYVTTDRFRIVNMSDNKMYNIENGITFNAIFGAYNIGGIIISPSGGGQYSGQVNVDRNEIAAQVPTYLWTTQFVRSAISLTNVIASGLQVIPTTTVAVNNNIITNVHKGILLSNWVRKNIINNSNTIGLTRDLYTTVVTQYGIEHDVNMAATPYGNSINANTVTGTGFLNNPSVYGIITTKCVDEHVVCNLTDGTTDGIEFAGGHINVVFDHNTMQNNFYGYVLSHNGVIGLQASNPHPADNTWPGAWTGGHFKTATLSGSSSTTSKMYIRTSGVSNYNPNGSGTSTTPVISLNLYDFTNGTLILASSPLPDLGCAVPIGGGGGTPGAALALMENIALDNIPFLNNPDQTKYINKNQLYRLLKADPALRSSSAVLQNFYAASLSTTREALSNIEDNISSGDLLSGQSRTNALSPANAIEDNYKTFFNAYLKFQTDSVLPSDSLALLRIAGGCPFTDGDVVYQARSLYNSIYRTNVYFEDNCTEITQRSFVQNEEKAEAPSEFDVMVYPNPNAGSFALIPFKADLKELTIKVTDINGRAILNKSITSSERMFNLELDVQNGIYMVFITDPGSGQSIVKRIVIQK